MDEFKVQYSNRLKFIGSSQTVDLEDFRILAIGNSEKSLPGAELELNNNQTTFPSANFLIGGKGIGLLITSSSTPRSTSRSSWTST